MPESRELARRLVDFDERLAAQVLEMICAELGGPASEGETDVVRMRAYLADPETARSRSLKRMNDVDDSPSSTAQWKSEFAHSERLRTLGVAIAERLAAGVPR